MADQDTRKVGDKVQFKLEHFLPPDVPVHYCDNLVVGTGESVVTLSFMQAELPLVSTPEEWASIRAVKSICKVRIIVTHEKFPRFVEALTRVLEGMQEEESTP